MASPPRDKSDPREQYNCPVCMENVRWRVPVTTRCGHVYCNHCIEIALENFCQRCPVCNQDLDEPTFPINLLNFRPGTRIGAMRRCNYRSESLKLYDDPVLARLKNGIIKDTKDVKDTSHYKCPMCAEDAIHTHPVAAECGHVFCGKCSEAIVSKCLICKTGVDRDKLVRLFL